MAPENGPGTPQAAALEWVDAVMDRADLAAAWPLTDPTLRLVLAQDWVWNHRHDPAVGHCDWEALARALAECPSTDPAWDRFAAELVDTWQRIWKGFSTHTWATSDQPEVLDLDLEMVTFVEVPSSEGGSGGDEMPLRPGRNTFARRFAMRHTADGWRVASINGDQLFRPGWPPTMGQQAGQA